MRKALLLPSYLGGGFGHIGRCLALANELRHRGWETAFALGGHHANRVFQSGQQVYNLRWPYKPRLEKEDGPAFTIFSDLNYQLVRDGLVDGSAILACVKEQLRIVRRFQPDILIADSAPLASILAYLAGLPLVQVVRSANHPLAPRLIWWRSLPDGLVSPDPRPVFNPLLEEWGLSLIERGEDLLKGDLYLVPSLPELDPLPLGLADTHYIGPLIRSAEELPPMPDWFAALNPDRPVIYVTLGGGAGPVGGRAFYSKLFEALGDSDQQVIASTGAKLSPGDLPAPPENIRIEAWVPGPAMIARSDLVIYPGGYGTTMELIQAGVPALVIPFHSEQESNGRRLESAGAGLVLHPNKGKASLVRHRWAGGEFSTLVHWQSDLSSADMREAVFALLASKIYRVNARRLQKMSQHYEGASQAGDLIEELYSSATPAGKMGWNRLSWRQKFKLTTPRVIGR
jgi:UDP:flavonoid glycosyltransferase YjiC (YdhE family)